MIEPNTPLPSFRIHDDQGTEFTQASFQGSWTIFYFYPKDETSGCTAQACSIRDSYSEFTKRGIKVFGISKDSVKSHQKFRNNHNLPFPLLSDTDHSMAIAFGVWAEKTLYGKKYMGMERSTALVNPEGIVVATFPNVSPEEHATFLLEHIQRFLGKE